MTENLKDFPGSALSPLGLVATTPDQLLTAMATDDGPAMADVVTKVAATLVRPPRSVDDILAALARANVTRFAPAIRPFLRA